MQARYFSFFWPLALSSLIFASGGQFRNAALSRYPDAARELSTYAYAFAAYVLLWSTNNFVPQVANVYARSRRGLRVALSIVLLINACSACLLLVVGTTHSGAGLLAAAYHIEGRVLVDVQTYLCWLSPLLLLSGLLQFQDGLLIQAERTRLVTWTRFVQVGGMAAMLVLGSLSGWAALTTLVCSHYAGSCLSVGFQRWACARHYQLPRRAEHADVRPREILRFMLPTTITSLMFTVTRPILYAALSRTADPLVAVAGLRIAYDVVAALQMVSNQFRHFFVTMGTDEDMPGKRRFMARVAMGLTLVLVTTLVPGPRELVFGTLLGVRDEVFAAAVAATSALVLVPSILMMRNYFHARLLATRAPNGMAVGAVLRVLLISGGCLALLATGALSARTAALSLALGFCAEVLASGVALKRVAARPAA